jgi:hypothetical protein
MLAANNKRLRFAVQGQAAELPGLSNKDAGFVVVLESVQGRVHCIGHGKSNDEINMDMGHGKTWTWEIK